MLRGFQGWLSEYPPLQQPMRFGNQAFAICAQPALQQSSALEVHGLPVAGLQTMAREAEDGFAQTAGPHPARGDGIVFHPPDSKATVSDPRALLSFSVAVYAADCAMATPSSTIVMPLTRLSFGVIALCAGPKDGCTRTRPIS